MVLPLDTWMNYFIVIISTITTLFIFSITKCSHWWDSCSHCLSPNCNTHYSVLLLWVFPSPFVHNILFISPRYGYILEINLPGRKLFETWQILIHLSQVIWMTKIRKWSVDHIHTSNVSMVLSIVLWFLLLPVQSLDIHVAIVTDVTVMIRLGSLPFFCAKSSWDCFLRVFCHHSLVSAQSEVQRTKLRLVYCTIYTTFIVIFIS